MAHLQVPSPKAIEIEEIVLQALKSSFKGSEACSSVDLRKSVAKYLTEKQQFVIQYPNTKCQSFLSWMDYGNLMLQNSEDNVVHVG